MGSGVEFTGAESGAAEEGLGGWEVNEVLDATLECVQGITYSVHRENAAFRRSGNPQGFKPEMEAGEFHPFGLVVSDLVSKWRRVTDSWEKW